MITPGKLDEIKCILHSIPDIIHAIVISETWIKSDLEAQSLPLPNYTHYYNYRRNSRGGGISIYAHNSVKHHLIEDVCKNDNHYLWVHLNKFGVDIGGIYKPERTDNTDFLETYSEQLEKRKRAIVLGDFNYDLLKKSQPTRDYKRALHESGYKILNKIDTAYCTRQTNRTQTTLDHICTNLINNKFHLAVVDSAMSDHKHLYLEMQKYKVENIKKLKYEAIDYEKFIKTLDLDITPSCDRMYEELEIRLITALKNSKKTKRKIQNPPRSDWINKDILDAINRRNQLWHMSTKKTETCNTEEEQKLVEKKLLKARKEVKEKIKEAKKSYYYKIFDSCKKKPHKMWQFINSLSFNKTKTQDTPLKLETQSGSYTKVSDICDCFNEFFANIGSILASQIPESFHDIQSYDNLYTKHTDPAKLLNFTPATLDEVSKIIDNLNPNTSTGLDGISCKALKSVKNLILDKLTTSINKCLERGYFPESLKIAKVSPIFKSGKKDDPGNYRPISVLPIMSKIFEKIIYNRLDQHLTSSNFLYKKQYGFRSHSNTLSACIDLVTTVKTKIDKKQIALGIFIDLKKAFDTISHKLLIHKLHAIGFRGTALKMLQSYLSNRYQVVKLADVTSKPKLITCGVPQGSILGPLLFLIYINNISELNLIGDITLYADDTCLFYFGDDIQAVTKQAQTDLNTLNTWFLHNLLTINVSKTNYMIFKAKNKIITNLTPLYINNEPIHKVDSEKYLGLTLDSNLTWKPHINKIRSKLSSLLGVLRNNIHCYPKSIRYLIYNSFIKSHLIYLIEVWGSAAKTNLLKLQRTQNKLVKLLFHLNYLTPTTTVYNKTKLMTLTQMYNYNTCILVRKILKKDIHTSITFTIKSQIRTRSSRFSNNIYLPNVPRTKNYGLKNFKYEGAQIYNRLPKDIKSIKSIFLFKKSLKHYILNKI